MKAFEMGGVTRFPVLRLLLLSVIAALLLTASSGCKPVGVDNGASNGTNGNNDPNVNKIERRVYTPDADQIKRDLIGKDVSDTNGGAGWRFDGLDEFQSFTINSQERSVGIRGGETVTTHASTSLKGVDNGKAEADLRIVHRLDTQGDTSRLIFVSVTADSYRLIDHGNATLSATPAEMRKFTGDNTNVISAEKALQDRLKGRNLLVKGVHIGEFGRNDEGLVTFLDVGESGVSVETLSPALVFAVAKADEDKVQSLPQTGAVRDIRCSYLGFNKTEHGVYRIMLQANSFEPSSETSTSSSTGDTYSGASGYR